ncbi:CbbBc protein, partial [Escherichia coli]
IPPRRRVWPTPNGKANILLMPGLDVDAPVDDPGMLRLATVRSHDQYNTTIYDLDDRYRGVFGRRDVLFMHADDLARHGLKHGDKVDLHSGLPGQEHRHLQLTAIAYDIAPGSVGAYYPEANNLCPLDYQDKQ